MCSNCASRSGLRLPSRVLRFTCRRYPSRPSSLGMLLLPIWCPIAHSAAASFAWLFETQRSGRIGSPIVAGSSNRRRSSSSVGSVAVSAGRPPPGAPNLTRQRVRIIEILQSSPNGAAGDPGGPRRRGDPAMPGGSCLRRREQPPTRSFRLRRTAANRSPIADASTIRRVYAVSKPRRNPQFARGDAKATRFGHCWASPNRLDAASTDYILDPFSGAGTTGIECTLEGFNSLGFEINPLLHFVGNVSITWNLDDKALLVELERIQADFARLRPEVTFEKLDKHGLHVPANP